MHPATGVCKRSLKCCGSVSFQMSGGSGDGALQSLEQRILGFFLSTDNKVTVAGILGFITELNVAHCLFLPP